MLRSGYWIALFLVPALFGQDSSGLAASASPSSWGTKTIQLKYLDPEELRRVFSGRSYVMQINRGLKLLTVSGPPQFLNEVEETGKRLDLAPAGPANLEITVYLLTTTAQAPSSQNLPPELQAIAKTLGPSASTLRLADSETLRVREGQAGEVAFGDSPSSGLSLASISVQAASVVSGTQGDVISLNGLRCRINKPPGQTSPGGDMTANIDLAQNQPALAAKAGVEKPLVIIVRAGVSR